MFVCFVLQAKYRQNKRERVGKAYLPVSSIGPTLSDATLFQQGVEYNMIRDFTTSPLGAERLVSPKPVYSPSFSISIDDNRPMAAANGISNGDHTVGNQFSNRSSSLSISNGSSKYSSASSSLMPRFHIGGINRNRDGKFEDV